MLKMNKPEMYPTKQLFIQKDNVSPAPNPTNIEAASISTNNSATDTTVTSKTMDIFGLTIKGISLDSFDKAQLQLAIPLTKGTHKISSLHKDAQTKIKKRTFTTIRAHVSKEGKKIKCDSLSLKFTKPITIQNPAAAFLSDTAYSKKVKRIMDKVADITCSSIEIDNQGNLSIDGQIFIFGKKFKALDRMMPPEMSNLNSLNNNPTANPNTPKISVAQFLKSISPAIESIRLTAQLETEPTAISVENHHVVNAISGVPIELPTINSEKATSKVIIDAMCTVDSYGNIHVNLNKDETKLRSGIIKASVGGSLVIENPTSKRRLMRGELNVSARTPQLNTELKVMKEIKIPITGQAHGHAHVDFEAQGHSIIINDSSTGHVKAHVDLKTEAHGEAKGIGLTVGHATIKIDGSSHIGLRDGALSIENGKAKMDTEVSDVGISVFGIKTQLDGTSSVSVHAHDINYKSKGMPTAKGTIHTDYTFSPAMAEHYAHVPSLKNKLDFELHDAAHVTLHHPQKDFLDFLPNHQAFEVNPTRIVGLKAKIKATIGSAELKTHLMEITNAPIRKNNSVKLLGEGNLSHKERLKLISEATSSVCLQTFVFKPDQSGIEMVNALKAAVQRGVKVRVIIDSLGTTEPLASVVDSRVIYEQLREAGVEVRRYNPLFEEGMQELAALLSKDLKKWSMASPRDLTAIPTNFALFKKLAEIAHGSNSITISDEDRAKLTKALGKVLGRDANSNPQAVIAELAQKLSNDTINLAHLLMLSEPIAATNDRWHEKYFIVDGHTAILGDVNTADEYLLGGTGQRVRINTKTRTAWKDIDVAINGDAAIDAYNNFARNWKTLGGEELPAVAFDASRVAHNDGVEVQIIQHRPVEDGDSHILNFLIENFKALQKGEKAYLEAGYFLPSGTQRKLMEAMMDAANRGADIRLLTNSVKSSDDSTLPNASIFDKREILAAGIRLFERTDDRTIHSKAFCFAGKLAVIGSYNLDNRSASSSSECTSAIYNEKFADELEKHIGTHMNDEKVKEVQLKDISSQPIFAELKSAGSAMFRDLL